MDKVSFIKKCFPNADIDIGITTFDLDIEEIKIADILNAFRQKYPENSLEKTKIKNKNLVMTLIFTSELLFPLKGIIFLINSLDEDISITSNDYILIDTNINVIDNVESINNFMVQIYQYTKTSYKEGIKDFDEFAGKYLSLIK